MTRAPGVLPVTVYTARGLNSVGAPLMIPVLADNFNPAGSINVCSTEIYMHLDFQNLQSYSDILAIQPAHSTQCDKKCARNTCFGKLLHHIHMHASHAHMHASYAQVKYDIYDKSYEFPSFSSTCIIVTLYQHIPAGRDGWTENVNLVPSYIYESK